MLSLQHLDALHCRLRWSLRKGVKNVVEAAATDNTHLTHPSTNQKTKSARSHNPCAMSHSRSRRFTPSTSQTVSRRNLDATCPIRTTIWLCPPPQAARTQWTVTGNYSRWFFVRENHLLSVLAHLLSQAKMLALAATG